jgi:hypothetical protein
MEDDAMPAAERRRCHRMPWRDRGVLLVGRNGRTQDCEILEIGGRGARVGLPYERLMPSEFDLVASGTLSFRARLVWREGAVLGLAFDGRPYLAPSPNVVRLPKAGV